MAGDSIFDVAGEEFSKKKKKKKKKKDSSPKKEAANYDKKPGSDITSEELQSLFDNVWKQVDQVNNALQDASRYTQMSPEDLKNFLENPDNFTPTQWKQIQNKKQKIEQEILDPGKEPVKKKKEDKERKGKTLGGRKKWMEM